MVYCNLIEDKGDSAVYYIGTSADDMTGKVVFYSDEKDPVLLNQAKEEPVRTIHLVRLLGKYGKFFENRNFPEKIAYEIG